ncbi:MAG: protein YgfX [Pseudomonadota bacterium]|nr:protein YgfX [Pseudomonadota bacterium]
MTKRPDQPPLRIRPGFSRRLAGFVLVTHAAALTSVALLPVAWYVRLTLALTVLGSLAYQSAVHLIRTAPWAVREALRESDGTWTLILASGARVDANLSPSTLVTTGLVVLNFRCGGWRLRSLVLLPDALNENELRRLRVRLRLSGSQQAAASDPLA